MHGDGDREPNTSTLRNRVPDHDDMYDPYEMLRVSVIIRMMRFMILDSNYQFSKFSRLKIDARIPLYHISTNHTKLSFVSKL